MIRTVTVLQDDIDNGEMGVHDECPIARAIRRDMMADWSSVGPLCLYYHDGEGRYAAVTTHAILQFIHRFDVGQPVEPQKFEVDFLVTPIPRQTIDDLQKAW